MAFGAFTIFEVQQGGDDTNSGGGFDPGVTMATDLAATSATGTAPVVTSATYTFVAGDVGHYLFIKSGTNWLPGWYLIASVAAGAATITATIGSVVRYVSSTTANLNIVAGCASTASPTAGSWSVDYSRSAAPVLTFTDMVIGGTTTQFTSVAHPVGPNMLGNFISVTAGTGFTVQRVEVTAFTALGVIATCDKSLGTTASTGGTGGLGGALATPGQAAALFNGGQILFIKYSATLYAMSSSSNVAGGRVNDTGNGVSIIGYSTNRWKGNTDLRPQFKPSSNTMAPFITSGALIANLDISNPDSKTSITGITINANDQNFRRIRVNGCAAGFVFNNRSRIQDCEASSNTLIGFDANTTNNAMHFRCVAISNGTIGFNFNALNGFVDCIAAKNGNAGFFQTAPSACWAINCTSAGNTGASGDGFNMAGSLINCLSYGNSQNGFNTASTVFENVLVNCAAGGNSVANLSQGWLQTPINGFVTLSADPFTNSASNDYSLNGTAGGGAACLTAGVPGVFAGLTTTTGYAAIGAVQPPGTATPVYPTRSRVFTGM